MWQWLVPALGVAAIGLIASALAFFARRWFNRSGRTVITIGDREPAEYVIRGTLSSDGKRILQDAPRFMNFSIPLTIKNTRGIAQTIRIKNVWFCSQPPVVNRGENKGWRMPGTGLTPTGIRVVDASETVVDPICVPAHGISVLKIEGTATTPVCHSIPFEDWKYVFIDWYGSPVREPPLTLSRMGACSYDPTIEPIFPLPAHYPDMQRSSPLGQMVEKQIREHRAKNSAKPNK